MATSALASKDYESAYYKEHKDAGLDYLGHGFWHESYAEMVVEVTLQAEYPDARMVDAGCACGSILNGFKKTGIFKSVLGADLSRYMVDLGRKHFGFAPSEIVAADIAALPLAPESLTLVHSAQVLEHVPDAAIDAVLDEFYRILKPFGRLLLCFDAVKKGQVRENYHDDPTHVNLRPPTYWAQLFVQHGFAFDVESFHRFVNNPRGPTNGDPRSFFHSYPNWTLFTLIKLPNGVHRNEPGR